MLEFYDPYHGWTPTKNHPPILLTGVNNVVIMRVKGDSDSNAHCVGLRELVRCMEILGSYPHKPLSPDAAPPDAENYFKDLVDIAKSRGEYLIHVGHVDPSVDMSI